MNTSHTSPKSILRIAASALAVLGFAAATAQTQERDTYEWSANLISFDESAKTAVFEARVESFADIDFDAFEEGDRLTLIWTGRSWAAGVRDLAASPELESWMLTLPVEYVGTARDEEYVSFRVAVPNDSVETLAAFEPGTRVTAVSPKSAAEFDEGIVSLRHYNDLSSDS